MTIAVKIKDKKALKTLEKMRADKLISFTKSGTRITRNKKDKIETHLASENVLARNWLTKNEDDAWQDL